MNIRDRIRELRRVKASELRPNPRNWRVHPQAQQDALRGILAEVGYVDALMARELPDGTLELVDGHLRAETTPDYDVPVLVVDLTEAEAAKVLATFDPLAAMAEASAGNLDALLREVDTGNEALQKMLAELADEAGLYKTGEVIEDEVPEPPADPVTKPGDLWLLGEHRLLCGSSADRETIVRLLDGNRPRLVVTSPPYNQGLDKFKPSGMQAENPAWVKRMASAYGDSRPEPEYQAEQAAVLDCIYELTTDDASIFYNHKHRYRDKQVLSPLEWLRKTKWRLRQEIIWDRAGSITLNARMFMPSDERIYWLTKGGFLFNDETNIKSWSTIWKINPKAEAGVSAPYPVELPARPIQACSEARDLVLEPYAGSGTTIIAAEQLNRRCYGLEIEPRYCDVICQRWAKLTGKVPTLETGQGRADGRG